MLKRMNLPNKLTLLRIAIVPFIVACMLIDFPLNYFVAGLLFGAAAITDAFDGNIARKNNLITDFGKFADPLADKILVISVLVCFLKAGLCGAIPLIIILFREFTVTSIRLVAAANGKVIAANVWGKFKTIAQITAIGFIYAFWALIDFLKLFGVNVDPETSLLPGIFTLAGDILIWIVTIITIISGIIYLKDNKEVISDM